MKWPVLRFVWESRGQKMETVSDALKVKWPSGFSESSLQRLTTETTEEVLAEVAAVVLALPVEPGFEHKALIVDAGLKALDGAEVDPAALLESLRSQLPGVDFEVMKRAIESLSIDLGEVGRRVDGHAKAESRERDEAVGKLNGLIRRGFWITGAVSVAVGALVVACLYPRAAGSRGAGLTRGGGLVEEATGGRRDAYVSLNSGIAGEGDTGERKRGRPMPHTPLPHQALAPCLGSATTMYGSCWLWTHNTPPCPDDQYQEGSNCFAPVIIEPQKPSSTDVP